MVSRSNQSRVAVYYNALLLIALHLWQCIEYIIFDYITFVVCRSHEEQGGSRVAPDNSWEGQEGARVWGKLPQYYTEPPPSPLHWGFLGSTFFLL